MRSAEILDGGIQATVQDYPGRRGMLAQGFFPAGPMDHFALRAANLLVGNPESAAALEITLGNFRLRLDGDTTVAITVLVGIVMAAWQGLWVVNVGVPSFVVTLAGLLSFRGIGYYLSDARTIAPVSESFSFLSEGFIPPAASYPVMGVVLLTAVALLVRSYALRVRERGGDLGWLMVRLTATLVSFGGKNINRTRNSVSGSRSNRSTRQSGRQQTRS